MSDEPQDQHPPRSQHLPSGTPRKKPPTEATPLTSALHEQSLEHQREAFINNAWDHLVACKPHDWYEGYLDDPRNRCWSSGTAERVKSHLLKLKRSALGVDGWKALLHSMKKNNGKGHENNIFGTMTAIDKAVVKAFRTVEKRDGRGDPGVKQTTNYIAQPTKGTQSELPGPAPIPDGSSILLDITESPESDDLSELLKSATSSVPYFAEYKKKETFGDRQKNERQIVGVVARAMRNDPIRTKMYALTIEKSSARLWCFTSSHIGISHEFDVHKNPELLIRYLLYLNFASKTQLGFDPTIERTWDEKGKIVYRLKVENKRYQTVDGPLSEQDYLISRRVRVWKVRELGIDSKPFGPLRVVKDCWLYEDAMGEKKIQDDIFSRLDENLRDGARRYFMTILHDWHVEVDGVPVLTPEKPTSAVPLAFLYRDPDRQLPGKQNPIPGSQRTQERVPHPQSLDQERDAEPMVHHRRKQMRTVFAEYCKTFYNIDNFHDMNRALRDYSKALWYMRAARYVHRDISGGNCLWYVPEDGSGGVGKLSDLEYAKPFEKSSCHDPITGTVWFMAVECQSGCYIFLPKTDERMGTLRSRNVKVFPVVHNYLHDLESVYWLLIWFFYNRVPKISVGSDRLDAENLAIANEIVKDCNRLFDGKFEGNNTRTAYLKTYSSAQIWTMLRERKWYDPLGPLVEALKCRAYLTLAYKDLEKKEMEDLDNGRSWTSDQFPAKELYDDFAQSFEDAIKMTEEECPGLDSTAISISTVISRHRAAKRKADASPPGTPSKRMRRETEPSRSYPNQDAPPEVETRTRAYPPMSLRSLPTRENEVGRSEGI